jgi:Tol biopolymer transport system component
MKKKTIDKIWQETFRISLLLFLFLFFVPGAFAQFYNGSQLKFGKNRVQYSEFIWTYYMFDDYDVYFYRNGQKLAEYTSRYVSEQLPAMERKLETILNEKIQFIVFNNMTDLKQSNIGLVEDEMYNTGGVTKIIGRKIILYFTGDYGDFEKQIRAGIANILINQLLNGGSIGSQIKNATLFVLPDWYLDGLISYISEDWSTEIDNRVRDGVLSGKYRKFNHLVGDDAIYAGHSLWKYIAEKYGKSAVPNILHMTNISNNVENGFVYVIQISFKALSNNWLEYFRLQYKTDVVYEPLPQNPLVKKPGQEVFYNQVRTSPDGKYATYITNELGQYKVWLYDTERKKSKKIFKAGFKLGENIDYSYPITAWHPGGKVLTFIVERQGFVFLYFYTLETRKLTRRNLLNFDKILDYSYSPDGKKLVLSAVQKGQSDIFVFDIPSGSHFQLTNDIFDDLNPHFFQNTKNIVFSSNRFSDTLGLEQDSMPLFIPKYSDLFLYDFENRSPILKRLSNTPVANEFQAQPYQGSYLSYLSDANGIYNQYLGKFDSAISRIDTTVHYRYFMTSYAVSNFPTSINQIDVNPKAGKISLTFFKNQVYPIFVEDQLPVSALKPLALQKTPYMLQLSEKEVEDVKRQDSSVEKKKTQKNRKRFRNVFEGEQEQPQRQGIDINNYEFDKQLIAKIGNPKSNIDAENQLAEPEKQGFAVPKRRNYKVEYFLNEVTTQVDFTFLNNTYENFTGGGSPIFLNPGFNALMKFGVSDLLEDWRIIGGVRLNVNLINNEYLLTLINLKGRLDKQYLFHRQTVEYITDASIIRYHTNEVFYRLSWPFNEAMRVRGTASLRNDHAVFLATDQDNLTQKGSDENWVGLKGEFNFDDTRSIGLNLYYGTRYKIFGEYYQLADKDSRNLVVLGVDFRKYTKIHRSFIWANRFAASTSFGNSKLIYYMGGVDTWLFPTFNQDTPIDYEQNYRYQTLATNMRGFDQNVRNGSNFAVINSELRFPIFRYFYNRPIKSDFLNNFQIVGFGDIGTAWNGWNPYSKENTLFTRVLDDGPLHIEYEIQKEPIVAGMGFGLRTRLLGYFVRADWAWGMEDSVVNDGIFYLSLSLDF